MIEISKTIQTKASPARVLDFFSKFGERFVELWPEAHHGYEITSAGPMGVGTTFRTVQSINGRRMSSRGVVTKVEPGGFAWRQIPLPLTAGGYRYRPLPEGGTEITQFLQYGPPWPVIGPVMLFLMEMMALTRRELDKHLDEEMRRFQQALEAEQ
jgi:hypothetical protein